MSVTLWPPAPGNPEGWWTRFWGDRTQDFGPPSDRVLDLIASVVRACPKGRAVDVGTGNGRYALPMAAAGLEVTAIDLAPTALERVTQAARNLGLHIRVEQGDFLQLCENVRSFQLVVSSGLLEELPASKQRSALHGFVRWSDGGWNIVKYCLEIEGRGQLVADGLVPAFYEELGWDVQLVRENKAMKPSRAGIVLRTGTVVAKCR
jgi:SAM-dependent methyltransferase